MKSIPLFGGRSLEKKTSFPAVLFPKGRSAFSSNGGTKIAASQDTRKYQIKGDPVRCPDCGLIQIPEAHCKRCGTALQSPLATTASSPETFLLKVQEEPKWYEGEIWAWVKELVFHVEPHINPIAFYGRAALYLVFLIWGWQFISMEYDIVVGGYPPIGQSFMHSVNLVFHEAGHVIFTPFGRFLTILGGTLGQWLIPFIVMCAFLLQTRDTYAATIGLWWLGQSFMDAAPYINDARAGQLILLGGVTGRSHPGYHDWENILRDLGWMQYDHTIAGIVNVIGVVLMLISFVWGAYVLYLQYNNLDPRY